MLFALAISSDRLYADASTLAGRVAVPQARLQLAPQTLPNIDDPSLGPRFGVACGSQQTTD
jgi:hypothetical protein